MTNVGPPRAAPPAFSGIVVLDKPRGPTSHDLVARARASFRTREVGHAGTLDPMATGVLVLGVRQGTKLLTFLTAHDKTYVARLALGETTETLDAEGSERAHAPVAPEVLEALRVASEGALTPCLRAALEAELWRTEQTPPVYSAIRTDGERSHALARAGRAVPLPPRPVRVHELAVTEATEAPAPTLELRAHVDKGYYVRSLGRDLALALGTVGHLTALRRTRSGPFAVEDAVTLDQVTADHGWLSLARAAALALPSVLLDSAAVLQARRGQRVTLPTSATRAVGPAAWLDAAGELVAVGERTPEGHGRVLRGFTPDAAVAQREAT